MKIIRCLLSVVLCGFSYVCAMDMGLVSFMRSGARIVHGYFQQPVALQECYLDQLPWDVQGEIFKNVIAIRMHEDAEKKKFVDLKKLEKRIVQIPILLGRKLFDEFFCLQKMCEEKICGKKFSAIELFCLPQKERNVFVRIVNFSMMSGNIESDDYAIIAQMQQVDIKKGLELEVRPTDKVFRFLDRVKCAGAVGVAIGIPTMAFLCLPFLCLPPENSFEKCRPSENSFEKCLSFIPIVGIFGGCGLLFLSDGILYAYNKLCCDEPVAIKKIKIE